MYVTEQDRADALERVIDQAEWDTERHLGEALVMIERAKRLVSGPTQTDLAEMQYHFAAAIVKATRQPKGIGC